MIKVPVVLAAVIAAGPCNAQDVRVFNGGQEHVYGPGGKILDSPELRAKNERARQIYEQVARPEQQRVPIQQNGAAAQRQAPKSWWDSSGYAPPMSASKSWWNSNGYQPPKSAWTE